MNNKVIIAGLVVVVVAMGGFLLSQTSAPQSSEAAVAVVTLHKSPYCGCCGVYGSYLEGLDYAVEVRDIEDMASVKERFGVPYELESCHTMEVAGYVIEGHIPEAAIQKLLEEKPDIKGIGMAGMPSGSPGMPGPKNGEFVIYEITQDGEKGDVFMRI
ncbi:MAG: DUF411 domain-containing protein [Candidatus Paceibacterota bacterium]